MRGSAEPSAPVSECAVGAVVAEDDVVAVVPDVAAETCVDAGDPVIDMDDSVAFLVMGIKCIEAGLILCSVSFAACRRVARSSFVNESASSPGSCRYVQPGLSLIHISEPTRPY